MMVKNQENNIVSKKRVFNVKKLMSYKLSMLRHRKVYISDVGPKKNKSNSVLCNILHSHMFSGTKTVKVPKKIIKNKSASYSLIFGILSGDLSSFRPILRGVLAGGCEI